MNELKVWKDAIGSVVLEHYNDNKTHYNDLRKKMKNKLLALLGRLTDKSVLTPFLSLAPIFLSALLVVTLATSLQTALNMLVVFVLATVLVEVAVLWFAFIGKKAEELSAFLKAKLTTEVEAPVPTNPPKVEEQDFDMTVYTKKEPKIMTEAVKIVASKKKSSRGRPKAKDTSKAV